MWFRILHWSAHIPLLRHDEPGACRTIERASCAVKPCALQARRDSETIHFSECEPSMSHQTADLAGRGLCSLSSALQDHAVQVHQPICKSQIFSTGGRAWTDCTQEISACRCIEMCGEPSPSRRPRDEQDELCQLGCKSDRMNN